MTFPGRIMYYYTECNKNIIFGVLLQSRLRGTTTIRRGRKMVLRFNLACVVAVAGVAAAGAVVQDVPEVVESFETYKAIFNKTYYNPDFEVRAFCPNTGGLKSPPVDATLVADAPAVCAVRVIILRLWRAVPQTRRSCWRWQAIRVWFLFPPLDCNSCSARRSFFFLALACPSRHSYPSGVTFLPDWGVAQLPVGKRSASIVAGVAGRARAEGELARVRW